MTNGVQIRMKLSEKRNVAHRRGDASQVRLWEDLVS